MIKGDIHKRKSLAYQYAEEVGKHAIKNNLELDARMVYRDIMIKYGVSEKTIKDCLQYMVDLGVEINDPRDEFMLDVASDDKAIMNYVTANQKRKSADHDKEVEAVVDDLRNREFSED